MLGNRRRLLIGLPVIAVIGGAVYWGGQNIARNDLQKSIVVATNWKGETKKPLTEEVATSAPDTADGYKSSSATSPPPLPHPFPSVPKSRSGLPLEGDPFTATSQAEQAWLDRNGYPNAEQWETYSQASDGLLLAAASAGDAVAKSMLDNRRLIAGDQSALEDILADGAEGSLFSLDMASSFLAGSTKGDPITGYALSRVVEMKGNVRVAMGRDAMFRNPLDPIQRMEAEAKALAIYKSLNAANKLKRRAVAVVDPRPIDG